VLNFEDASVDAVLEYLSEVAGFVVIKDTSVDGRVSLLSLQPVSPTEAVTLLNSVLKDRGYAAVQSGRTLKVMTLEEAKKNPIPVRSGSNPDLIEPTDEIITYIIPIQFADAVRLRADLAPLIPSYADMSANQSSNALIYTDTAANVRRIAEIVRALDTHLAGVTEVKVVHLTYANATEAARLVNEIFRTDSSQQGQTRGQAGRFGAGAFSAGGGGGRGQQQQQQDRPRYEPRVTASADARTNTVVVSGPPDTLVVVETVLKDLDANPAEEQGVFTYVVKNGKAANLATVLNNLFRSSQGTAARGTTGGSTFRGGTTGTGTTGTGTGRTGTTGTGTTRGGTSRGGTTLPQMGAGMTATTRTGTVLTQAARSSAGGAATGLAGQVYVVADADSNSVLVMTDPGNFERVRAIIEALDKSVPQVLIKVLIAEVSHDNTMDLGAEFSILNLGPDELGTTLSSDFSIAALADQTGGLIYKIVRGDFTATLLALEKVGKLDVLSRPYILTSDNQAANITVGQRVPFITRTQITDAGQVINTIQYEDVGIILDVTPHINAEGLVIMDVSPQISSLTETTVPISETVNAPVFNQRSAQSRVAIRDGQTIVIGGLMEDRKDETVKKVPILGDIPVLGWLFRYRKTTKVKTELLIFLTPHVAHQPGDLKSMSEDEQKGIKVVPDAVSPGTFDEHMEGMQRGAAKHEEGTE
jgi:general secretion pathway protein D